MKLLVEGEEKVRIEAVVEKSKVSFMNEIFGPVTITGEHFINNPKSIEDTEMAYHILENIHNTEYPYNKVKIEIEYE